MRSRNRPTHFRFIATGVAALSAAALAVLPAGSVSATSTITYDVHPIARLAIATSGAQPGGFPYTPSQCVTHFGFACYGPSDFRSGYDVPTRLDGSGQTIVIVDAYGSPTLRNDLAVYDAEFGLPPAKLNILYPGGSPTYNPLQSHDETSWAEETSLDVEQAHGLAPQATIDLVIAANNNGDVLDNAEQYAVANHLGNVLSMSYGAPEAAFNGNSGQQAQAEAIDAQAAQEQMSVFASAGDTGAAEGTTSPTSLFPASDPNVTAVGGTNLFLSDSGSYQSETTWNDLVDCPFGCSAGPIGATGGAPSTLFRAPAYQQGITGEAMRTTADVSFNASVYTATMIYLGFLGAANDGFYFFGGTSEGAPSWAALTALADEQAGHPLGSLNPLLYGIARSASAYRADFHDVTVGNNDFGGGGFPAGPGYDVPTGLGSPNAKALFRSLAAGL
ncbi:MAG: S53 family peptidase [Actinomycetota bacterium]|nr:S53 family peptidase [Actinomycetota bacterium]